jgi:outer membrane immunogenic protein
MRKFIVAAALTAAAVSAPAFAAEGGEGRIEARGGIAFASGNSEAIAGVAAGYDFDLGESAFAGIEASADKLLVGGTDVLFGATARAGGKVGANGKLFVAAGYTFGDGDAFHAGAGYEHKLGENVYGKLEYRRFFVDSGFPDINTVAVGVGFKF